MTYEPLPLRSAMHRDVPSGSRLEIANAYAVGRLIDGQAIADAWQAVLDATLYQNTNGVPRLLRSKAPGLVDLLDALIEEDNDEDE